MDAHISGIAMILGIQTALSEISIGLVDSTKTCRQVSSWHSQRDEAARLLPSIQQLLQQEKIPVEALQGVIAVTGPGSFTALRVGISVANTIGYVQQIPLYGVSSFTYVAAGMTTTPYIVISASLRECFLRTPAGDELLCTVEDAIAHIGTAPWTGSITPAQVQAWTNIAAQQLTELPTETQRWEALTKNLPEATTLLVPSYLKGASITERKTR